MSSRTCATGERGEVRREEEGEGWQQGACLAVKTYYLVYLLLDGHLRLAHCHIQLRQTDQNQ